MGKKWLRPTKVGLLSRHVWLWTVGVLTESRTGNTGMHAKIVTT